VKTRTKKAHRAVYDALRAAGYPRRLRVVCIIVDDTVEPSLLDIVTILPEHDRNGASPGMIAISLVETALGMMHEAGEPVNPEHH
jgi:hypothetical protein